MKVKLKLHSPQIFFPSATTIWSLRSVTAAGHNESESAVAPMCGSDFYSKHPGVYWGILHDSSVLRYNSVGASIQSMSLWKHPFSTVMGEVAPESKQTIELLLYNTIHYFMHEKFSRNNYYLKDNKHNVRSIQISLTGALQDHSVQEPSVLFLDALSLTIALIVCVFGLWPVSGGFTSLEKHRWELVSPSLGLSLLMS